MKLFASTASQILAAIAVVAIVAASASADLLVYEGFNYAAGSNLNGLGSGLNPGGTGFAEGSSWNASASNGGFVQVQPYNAPSGVILSDGSTVNPFQGRYTNLVRTGNYVGMNDGGSGATGLTSGVADHVFLNRQIDATVTGTFLNDTKTYFSLVSARGYNAQSRMPTFTIGSGVIYDGPNGTYGDDVTPGGSNSSKEAIGVGGLTTNVTTSGSSTAVPTGTLNGAVYTLDQRYFARAQYWNSSGTRTGWGKVVGAAVSDNSVALTSSFGSGPAAAGNSGVWAGGGLNSTGVGTGVPPSGTNNSLNTGFALYGYTGSQSGTKAIGNNEALVNITVGEIAWGAGPGGTDLVSYFMFHDNDALSLAAFNAGKMTWDTGVDSSSTRGGFNYISMGGGRYFADELRLGTTFADVTPAVVPEPSTYVLLVAAGLGSLITARCRRRR